MEILRFKPSAGAGRAFYSPRKIPALWTGSANIQIKGGANNKFYEPSGTTFFTHLASVPGTAQHELTAANEYQTLVDITGAGWLGWVMSGTYYVNDATHTQYLRFTVDGVAYEFSKQVTEPGTTVGYRHVIGGVIPASATAAANAGRWGILGSYGDSGFQYSAGQQNYIFLSPTELILAYGGAALRFDRSLKIEHKTSNLDAIARMNIAVCDYMLEGAA